MAKKKQPSIKGKLKFSRKTKLGQRVIEGLQDALAFEKAMASKPNFPSEKELSKIRKELSRGIASRPLAKNASSVEILKHELCREFVVFRAKSDISQKELANKLGIDTALMSKILHYHFDDFTVDRLVRYLEKLHHEVKVSVKVA